MNCPKCGTELPDNATICTNCGEELVKTDEEVKINDGAVSEEQTGFSITGFILSIASIVCIFVNSLVAMICSILAIVFGAIGRKKVLKDWEQLEW